MSKNCCVIVVIAQDFVIFLVGDPYPPDTTASAKQGTGELI
jgi:hypothetical protein